MQSMEGSQRTLPTRCHAFSEGAHTGIIVGVAAVPTVVWTNAGIRGRPQRASAGTGMEEEMQGTE